LAITAHNAFGQSDDEKTAFDYLEDSLVNVLTVSTIVQVADFEYIGGNALWGTYLEAGKHISLNGQFDAGVEYLMLGAAHTEKTNIYLKVYQGQGTGGTIIAQDTSNDAAPCVRFKPSISGLHCFELINASNSPAFVSLVILKQKRNANFTFDSLVETVTKTLTLSKYIAEKLPSNSEIPANVWSLFGGNISQGNVAGFHGRLARGTYVLVGAGENSVNDCDVEVIEQNAMNNSDLKRITQNTNSQYPFDFAIFSPNPSNNQFLRVINKSSKNASAFMFGFLILAKK
jgi:hypothetical protein